MRESGGQPTWTTLARVPAPPPNAAQRPTNSDKPLRLRNCGTGATDGALAEPRRPVSGHWCWQAPLASRLQDRPSLCLPAGRTAAPVTLLAMVTAGQRSSGGGGAADESLFELFFAPTTRAFFALIAVLSASALPFVFLLLVLARRKFIAQQQVLPT